MSRRLLSWLLVIGLPVGAALFVGCAKGSSTPTSSKGGGPASTGGSGGESGSGIILPVGGSGGVASTPAGAGGTDAGAPVNPCDSGQKLCSGQCVDVQANTANCGACGHACSGDEICNAGSCECPYTRCGGSGGAGGNSGLCVDTSTSVVHCGSCYAPCGLGETCVDGVCSCNSDTLTRCGAFCVDLSSDNANCGACDNPCPANQFCSQGECKDECQPPSSLCDDGNGGLVCVDVTTSAAHCGDCATACQAGWVCSGGSCVCAPGTKLCGSTCVNTNTSLANCGDCNLSCAHVCTGGECVCEPGLNACGTDCADFQTDNTHCGDCATACLTGSSCQAGVCTCNANLTKCPGVAGSGCTNTRTDDANCGACGTSCGTEASCVASKCTCDTAGLTFCSGTCFDLNYDRNHCGSCANACAANQICDGGACVTPELYITSTTPILDNQVNPSIRICKQSSSSTATLQGLTIKYWYTIDGTSTNQIPTLPYSQVPATVTATRLNPALTNADFVLEVAITGSPAWDPYSLCVNFQPSVHGTAQWYPYYDVTNDYSYLEGDFVTNTQITLYRNGNLIWGVEPPAL